jgi:hypothetical protein
MPTNFIIFFIIMKKSTIFFWSVILFLILFYNVICLIPNRESFVVKRNNIDLPNFAFSETSCKNKCSPQNRCTLTGEQCSYDADCFGCQNPENKPKTHPPPTEENKTPSFLTSDITETAGTLGSPDSKPLNHFKGMDTWTKQYDAGQQQYNKRFSPSAHPFSINYPKRPSLTGEFKHDGPLESNY